MNSGIHNIPAAEYHLDPCSTPSLSCGLAKVLLSKSPAHARLAHPRLNPDYVDKYAGQFDTGTAAHSMLLEGEDIVRECEFDSWRTKAAKEAREEARANNKVPLLTKDYEVVQAMLTVAQQAIKLVGIDINDGKPEQTIIWQEGDTYCRIRPDWLSNDRKLCMDYKTTAVSNPRAWMRSIPSLGYDVQESFYRRGIGNVCEQDAEFVFLVQETEAPYLCYFVGLPESYQEIGHQKVETALTIWNSCMKAGQWPGYSQHVMYAEPANWQLADAEELAGELDNPNGIVLFDKDAPGAKENFLFGSVANAENPIYHKGAEQ